MIILDQTGDLVKDWGVSLLKSGRVYGIIIKLYNVLKRGC